uniref:phospholipase D n=1 Tax=Tolypothrix bouteillei VB521301 TaxID=1479485 RepID=A0A0C1R4N6_9CYAN
MPYKSILFLLLLLIGGITLFNNFQQSSKETLLKPLPQDPAIKVYFNHNPISFYKDPYRNFTRKGDNLEQQIIDTISQARFTVDIAVMELRLPKVVEALTLAHKRGVKVRVLIDSKYNKTIADYTPEEIAKMNQHDKRAYEELKRYPVDALAILRASGIEIKDDTSSRAPKGSGLMHHKFVVVDGKTTIISSGNLTNSDLHGDFSNLDSRGNPNNTIVIPDNKQIASVFTQEFNYMWQGLFKSYKPKRNLVEIPVGRGTIAVNFSPNRKKDNIATTSNGIIASYIQQAQKSIHIAVFVYSDQKISDTLGEVRDRGIEDIKVLIDPDFFRQPYSKAYDAMGVCPHPSKSSRFIKVKPWKRPITTVGFPTGLMGDRGVHSKMAVLDGVLAIAGSHNWSNSGNYLNDETLVFIKNSIVAAHYEREFNRLYETAELGLKTLPSARKCSIISILNQL